MSRVSQECLRALEFDLLRSKRHDIDEYQRQWLEGHLSECSACGGESLVLDLLADDGTAGAASTLDELARHRAIEDILVKADDPAFDPYGEDSFSTDGEAPSNWKRVGILIAAAAAIIAFLVTPFLEWPIGEDATVDNSSTLAMVSENVVSGRFSLLAGEVSVSSQPIDIADELGAGENLVTNRGSAVVHLPTKIVASIGSESRISLSGSRDTAYELWLHSGEVVLLVDPARQGPPFSVRTEHGRVNVVGTIFSVNSRNNVSEVRVLRGKVEVQSNRGNRGRVETGMVMALGSESARPLEDPEREELWKNVQILELIGDPDDAVVDVRSFPVGADVAIDGQVLGVTPVVASIRSGHRHLTVSLEDEEEVKELIDLGSGTRISRVFDLSEKLDAAVEEEVAEEPQGSTRSSRRVVLSKDEMLSVALSLRAQRKWRSAAKAYDELIDVHPGSAESAVALVSLGTIQLERLNNPRSAMRSFSQYLSRHPSGSLAREAMLSKAKALRVMGREAAERKILEQFQDRYSSSIHAEQVERRLDELNK